MTDSVRRVLERLEREKGSEEIVDALNQAIEFNDSPLDDAETIVKIGGCWIAEEALAIAVSVRFVIGRLSRSRLRRERDNDSTDAITGNILGCY